MPDRRSWRELFLTWFHLPYNSLSQLRAHIAIRELNSRTFIFHNYTTLMQGSKKWEIKIERNEIDQRSTETFNSGKRIGWHISWLTRNESVMELLSCPITDRSTIIKKLILPNTEQSICSPMHLVSGRETVDDLATFKQTTAIKIVYGLLIDNRWKLTASNMLVEFM